MKQQTRMQIIVILLLIFSVCVYVKNANTLDISKVSTLNGNKYKFELNNTTRYDIEIYYPKSKNKILGEHIRYKLEMMANDFKKKADSLPELEEENKYSLKIEYNEYGNDDFISYVFMVAEDLKPDKKNYFFTINYNKKTNTFSNINDLMLKNSEILNIFSITSREKLANNTDLTDFNLFISGTFPIKQNFSNFVYTNDGILLFFNEYQVSHNTDVKFKVLIPYAKLIN